VLTAEQVDHMAGEDTKEWEDTNSRRKEIGEIVT
jgi:hypothetical protein